MSPIKKYSKKSKTQKGGTRGHSTVHPASQHNHRKNSNKKLVKRSLKPIYAWGEGESPEHLDISSSYSTADGSNSSSIHSGSSGRGSYKEFAEMSRRYNAKEPIIELKTPAFISPKRTPHRPSKERRAQSPEKPIKRASKVAAYYSPSPPNSPSRRYIQREVTSKMTRGQLLGEMPQFNENTTHEERHRDLNPIKNAIKYILGHKKHKPQHYNLRAKDIEKLHTLLNQHTFSEKDIKFIDKTYKDIHFDTTFPTEYSNEYSSSENSNSEGNVPYEKHTSLEEDPRAGLLKAIEMKPNLRHVEHVNKSTKKINTIPTLGQALLQRVPVPKTKRGSSNSNSNSNSSGSNSEWK
jgi:hypothetical protein